ncbi:MAG TPA: redox-sensing transcriptional repressor Rex [Bryobacteraceae bacterium]|nr:redox-sensing transcriptional repressor Rex [Bryobacteraceae bacterium]
MIKLNREDFLDKDFSIMASPVPASRNISDAGLRRLAAYHKVLQEMLLAGTSTVSSSGIARVLKLEPSQVRKDIEATGIAGKPKVGYPLAILIRWIEDFLGWNNTKQAVLAGAGSLGSALLGYQKFRQLGMDIVAVFDSDPQKAGRTIHGKQVFFPDKLPSFALGAHIHLGVITTPAPAAQDTADLMVAGGIRAIWNFAPVHLRVPEFLVVRNEDLYDSIASLTFKLEKRMMAERKAAAEVCAPAESAVVLLDACTW